MHLGTEDALRAGGSDHRPARLSSRARPSSVSESSRRAELAIAAILEAGGTVRRDADA